MNGYTKSEIIKIARIIRTGAMFTMIGFSTTFVASLYMATPSFAVLAVLLVAIVVFCLGLLIETIAVSGSADDA